MPDSTKYIVKHDEITDIRKAYYKCCECGTVFMCEQKKTLVEHVMKRKPNRKKD